MSLRRNQVLVSAFGQATAPVRVDREVMVAGARQHRAAVGLNTSAASISRLALDSRLAVARL
jgi:hypothetical protein